MSDEIDLSVVECLRRDAFEEVGRMTFMADDYALKLFDATETRDLMAVAVRLQQLRFCTMAMIQTFNLVLRMLPHDQGMAEAGSSDADREDQQSGDGVA